ncbi:response regulator transcription factor [Crossiella sp. SN42]|uniref:response regulator transcription factor n=1 Tax=Crossiella sp. SN42 TaxID=2944808 RepID=UPI00207C7E58|nr:response regulator transcription factor [Crossiella sp. SN42]MCO1579832.1 response regulator transcription factor [Crossiella sp. SN42]
MIRVAVAEDMTVLREALVSLFRLEPDIEVVAETGRGDTVAGLVERTSPDVLLLDIELPGADGLTVARQLRATAPGLRLLLLSVLDRPAVLQEALSLGVHGFLPKGRSVTVVLDAIRRVHRGETVITSDGRIGAPSPLTRRELAVLELMARGDTAKEVARALNLATGTVQNHMTRVLDKLGARNKVDAIRLATDHGWLTGYNSLS